GGPHLLVRVTPGGTELRIARISGEGEGRLARDASNRLIQAAHLAAEAAGRDPGELRAQLEVHSSIPLRRGLGSSAAAALAGALLADRLLDGAIGEERALGVAVRLEGHPDNGVPSLLAAAREAGGAGAALSGAGTTVLALCSPGEAHHVARAMRNAAEARGVPGRPEVVEVGVPGARILA